MSLFSEIRTACREVAENARFVAIDRERLREYARALSATGFAVPKLDPTAHLLGRGEETLAFIVVLDTINFGSGWFPYLKKRPGKSGYFTIASSLRDAFEAGEVFSAQRLAAISSVDCIRLFEQDSEGSAAELMARFAEALNQLGHLLQERFGGTYVRLVESANGSAEALVETLRAMPFFDDAETWRGRQVPFYKRAQLTAADLSLVFDRKGWGRFDDLDQLTIFADNLVPHVLRVDGVLVYDEDLAARIDREELIGAGSSEEIEIRACALHAVELIVEDLRKAGQAATAMKIDFLLWNRGQTPQYKNVKPRHRTQTVFY